MSIKLSLLSDLKDYGGVLHNIKHGPHPSPQDVVKVWWAVDFPVVTLPKQYNYSNIPLHDNAVVPVPITLTKEIKFKVYVRDWPLPAGMPSFQNVSILHDMTSLIVRDRSLTLVRGADAKKKLSLNLFCPPLSGLNFLAPFCHENYRSTHTKACKLNF